MKARIQNILACIKTGTYEREEVLALSLLSSLAGESIFLLGLPGVGKSMVARRLKTAFAGASSFEYLMSRFSTPDEIFGPVSISKLKDTDSYERITAGYLPEAEIVFLDEIWKAGPSIQNSLLTVLNEKIFLNGNREMHLPVKGVIAASNELPAEGEGLEALWDRFILSYIVEPLQEKRNFAALVSGMKSDKSIVCKPLSPEEYSKIKACIESVVIPDNIINILYKIRERMNKLMKPSVGYDNEKGEINQKFYISDRRWKKACHIMKTSAYLNGRKEIDASDLLLLRHILWNDDSQIKEINQIVAEETMAAMFRDVLDKLKSSKRHAIPKGTNTLYSPDKVHYVVQCDDFQLKLKIADYEVMLDKGGYYFASETADGRLILRDRGQYALQVVKAGSVIINSYSYPLQTEADQQLTNDFLGSVGETIETLVSGMYSAVAANMFVCDAAANKELAGIAETYKARIKKH